MSELLKHLNQQQQGAVEYNSGPSLIIAGAGSGKTRVLTYKIAYLLEQGMHPQSILALTFTNKAAREMKERIAQLVGAQKARYLWMGTFHSIFSRILRAEAEKIGYNSNFTIADSADSRNLIKTIIKQFLLDDKIYKPSKVQNTISAAKNALISPVAYMNDKQMVEYDTRSKVPMIKDIYIEYNRRLKASNTMDFDDLLFNTNCLFRDHPDVLASYQNRFQFILVDEYQDTNFSQYLVVKQLADAHHRICVVGDDAQSIYSFRGANIENILKFKEVYPESKLFKLEQNYRSTQNIVDAANSLIGHNHEQIKKNVFSENDKGERIEVVSAYSDFEEGVIVANKIQDLRRSNKSYGDFVILYRTNAQSRIFEEALRKVNIPYRIYGGLSFYQRKEIKDVIAYLRLIINPSDEEAFKRIINFPARGIGATTVGKIADAAHHMNVSLWQVINDPLSYGLDIKPSPAKKVAEFRAMIEEFMSQLHELSAYELANLVVKKSGIANDAYQDNTPEGMSRQQNLQELLGGIHEFCETRQEEGNENISLMDFLAEVSLLTDQDTDKEAEQEKVTMMTVHAAKGLEFKNVFIVGLEEDLFPSSMAKNEFKGLEEERRLFYVALTRAEEFCMVTYARSRFKNGTVNPCNPSRFLKDIDSQYLNVNKGVLDSAFSYSGGASQNTYLDNWDKDRDRTFKARSQEEPNYKSDRSTLVQRSSSSLQNRRNFVSADRATPKATANGGSADLAAGNLIKHERFGVGKVIAVEGNAENRKATVEFENSGTKQLLLKFARFEIIR